MYEIDLIDLEYSLRKELNFVLGDDVREKLRSDEIHDKQEGATFIINNTQKTSFTIKGKQITLLTMKEVLI